MEILPTQFRRTSRKPHPWATALWTVWASWFVITLMDGTATTAVPCAIAFGVLEGAAVALGKWRGVTATLSAVIWWYVPHFFLRWALAVVMALSAWAFIHMAAGLALLFWLPAHLAWTERAAIQDERRVEQARKVMTSSPRDLDYLAKDMEDHGWERDILEEAKHRVYLTERRGDLRH